MGNSIKGRVRPNFEPNQTKIRMEGYGWRKSVHKGWVLATSDGSIVRDDWPTEVAIFFEKLVNVAGAARIKVCAALPTGEFVEECLLDPSKNYEVEEKLADLDDKELNLAFDPVPWRNGKRLQKTRMGFGTVTNGHPFDYFPEPCIFWAVGVKAFQFLAPWNEPKEISESVELLRGSGLTTHRSFQSMKDDLLVVPGSFIYSPTLPPFSAEVRFDAFSKTEVEYCDAMWTRY